MLDKWSGNETNDVHFAVYYIFEKPPYNLWLSAIFGENVTNIIRTSFETLFMLITMQWRKASYRSRALLGACTCNSTGRKYAPISEMCLITHIIIMTFLE